MDKVIVDKPFGGDGADVTVGMDGGSLAVEIKYPLEKLMSPLNSIIDKAIDAVEAAIPGDWDKAVMEPIRVAAKAELVKLIGG